MEPYWDLQLAAEQVNYSAVMSAVEYLDRSEKQVFNLINLKLTNTGQMNILNINPEFIFIAYRVYIIFKLYN